MKCALISVLNIINLYLLLAQQNMSGKYILLCKPNTLRHTKNNEEIIGRYKKIISKIHNFEEQALQIFNYKYISFGVEIFGV